MSKCLGCFPRFQENQMAHMDPGGCMYVEDLEEISMISQASLHSEHVTDSIIGLKHSEEESSEQEECCICYENIGKKNNCVTECGHKFCFKCLAMAMTRSNACPCCRQPLMDEPEVVDDEDESEYDEDDDDTASDISDDVDEDNDKAPVEIIAERLEKSGITMIDMICMFMGTNVVKASEKYTPEYFDALYEKCDNIVDEARREASETALFAQEDARAE